MQLRGSLGHYAVNTANGLLATVRAVLCQCWMQGQLSADAYMRIQKVPRIRGQPLPAGRALTRDELARCFAVAGGDSPALRSRAVLALLYATGMRCAELRALQSDDYEPTTDTLSIRHGKGNVGRLAYLGAPTLRVYVTEWLTLRGSSRGSLICGLGRDGHVRPAHHVSAEAVRLWLHTLAAAARIPPFTPHDLRRTCATHLAEAGVDVEIIARILGHAQLTTTQLYLRRGEDSKRRAGAYLVLPLSR